MSVDDHGLETIKKSGVDIKPSTAPKTDYAIQVRQRHELFSFFRARRTTLNATVWTLINIPANTEHLFLANNTANKTIWITSDNTIAVGDADGSFPIFPVNILELFLKRNGAATLYGAVDAGTEFIYAGGESNV